ncbi:IS3 family transposase [Streptomyces sp. NBC_00690]|uniref:IS3 family transposase n=1 Tax=Streptomyces sp. NBC_00690 TaxID=2975808 RepID=UPI002E2B3955|nr:IS3 family transposase [Streptomyces sp. NBC_00690]
MKTAAWDFVPAHAEMFGIKRTCRVLEVSRSGYYRWIAGAPARAERQAAEDALVEEIREIHGEHRGELRRAPGPRRTRGFGHTVNRKRVARLMRKHGIIGRHLRKKKRTRSASCALSLAGAKPWRCRGTDSRTCVPQGLRRTTPGHVPGVRTR